MAKIDKELAREKLRRFIKNDIPPKGWMSQLKAAYEIAAEDWPKTKAGSTSVLIGRIWNALRGSDVGDLRQFEDCLEKGLPIFVMKMGGGIARMNDKQIGFLKKVLEEYRKADH